MRHLTRRSIINHVSAHAVRIAFCLAAGWTLTASAHAPPPSSPPTTAPATQPQTTAPQNLPPAKQIIEASQAALGDPKVVNDVSSISSKATLHGPMGDVNFDLKTTRNGAFFLKQSLSNQPGFESTVCYDGKIGWMVGPDGRAQLVDEATLEQGRQQFRMLFPFWLVLHPTENFQSFETVDRVQYAGEDCYKVRLFSENEPDIQRFGYYDTDDSTIRGIGVVQESPMGPVNVDFVFSDWKEFDGVKMFTVMNVEQMGQQLKVDYTEIAFNKVDPSVFEPPPQVQELLKPKPAETQPQPAPPPATAPENSGG